ncbi:MAG TPA: glycogen synthase GlgA [Blastocatellia bacterium]|nr:glycogen synthase GlgA [Blastocatellia bacterium]
MNILLAASEAVPYAKTGGLADVAGALPKALTKLGHRVRVVLPRYNLEPVLRGGEKLPGSLLVPFKLGIRPTDVYADYSATAPVYFIDAPEYFSRGRLYGENDDVERFAFFSRAVLELAKATGEHVDVIHLNDWMTGLVPAFLKTAYAGDPFFAWTRTLFTIHNIAFLGHFNAGDLGLFGLPEWLNRPDTGIEFFGGVSALKAGIVFADAISTVSTRYAQEIQTAEFGNGFEGLLRARSQDLFGILNGVDYEEWNPEKDPFLAANFSIDDLSGKQECKRDLIRTFGLTEAIDRPLVASISRLSDQKGFDLIIDIALRMLDRGISFVLLGSGDDFYQSHFQALHDARPAQVGVYFGFSNELAHKIEAGADIFLMPSKFEPCGLNQMYSLRYGTAPIVRAAGGLDDTVENFDRSTGRGNGFKFYDYDSTRLLEKVYESLLIYIDRQSWRSLIQNGMRADFSWDVSARRYADVYEQLARRGARATV